MVKWLLFLLQAAVEVFGLVQELLPAVSALNQKYAPPTFNPNQSTDSTTGNQPEQGLSACTTSNHYSVMESDHPYKQAAVTQYRVNYYAGSASHLRLKDKIHLMYFKMKLILLSLILILI